MPNNTIEKNIRAIINALGENPKREGLLKTPTRVAKSLHYLTSGYHQKLEDIVGDATFISAMSEMIIVKDIELFSLCEHHLLPFYGKCHVAYIPQGKIIGLSKLSRIVDMFAKRLQVQEQLTEEIAEAILQATHGAGVGVVIEAKHLCMMMRGVEKQHSTMTTSVTLGIFREDARTRSEFLHLIK